MRGTVLFVDDDEAMVSLLVDSMLAAGYDAHGASSGQEALSRLAKLRADAVVTDLRMKGMSGLELCAALRDHYPDLPVILLTAFGDIATAVEAIRTGVYDFLSKPVEMEQLELRVGRAVEHRRLHDEVRHLRRSLQEQPRADIVGNSPAMRQVFDLLPRAARSDVPVLISGETGTGKGLVARALHEGSPRASQPFVAVNCAALPEPLLESELFGHVRGAFTDARHDRRGLFVDAGGGTLLLDEMGELPLALQPKLLRVLQEGKVRPVGSDKEVAVRCRVLAASNRDLRQEVQSGRFRGDLYYRLAVVRITLPPLRDRAGDVLTLAQHFLERAARRSGRRILGITTPVARALVGHSWPGNVRELENCIEGAVALTEHDRLVLADLPEEVRGQGEALGEPELGEAGPEPMTLAEVERRHIERVLDFVAGNKAEAARILDIDRRTLYRKLERFEEEGGEGGTSA
ncbi:MAG: sigma-54-dependent Fis family transcriptional regulator [Alphaproteobacteria bacterium]|nr:sigma-54-dependent Fis family transcriptional regulator [Alphaproteobacteria bacterium]MCB9797755.1 sigma-54-dependent Fis family transcriptional regulator [Alphaproteobacteria bacterium]